MRGVMIFSDPASFRTYAFNKRTLQGLNLEFGVRTGTGVNLFASLTTDRIYGFDSFVGLKEDWPGAIDAPAGKFTQKGKLPSVKGNVSLVKGWFDETLPAFLEDHTDLISFVNVDCDTYESTNVILNLCVDRFSEGTVIIFDEYIGFPDWERGEFLAWKEFIGKHGVSYKYISFSDNRVAIIITGIERT